MKPCILCIVLVVLLFGVGQVQGAVTLPHQYAFDTDATDSAGANDGTLVNGASIVLDPERGGVLQLDGLILPTVAPGPPDQGQKAGIQSPISRMLDRHRYPAHNSWASNLGFEKAI